MTCSALPSIDSPALGIPAPHTCCRGGGEKYPVHKLSGTGRKQLPRELDRSFSSAATLVITGIEYGLSQPGESGV